MSPSNALKRGPPDPAQDGAQPRDTPSPPKRHRQTPEPPPNSSSFQLYQEFRQRYKGCSSYTEFLGLCAYLYSLLKMGFCINSTDLDIFISQYRTYLSQRPEFEPEQARSHVLCIPSYHQWFRNHIDRLRQQNPSHSLLAGKSLYVLQQENPYTFLCCEHRLINMISRCKKDLLFA